MSIKAIAKKKVNGELYWKAFAPTITLIWDPVKYVVIHIDVFSNIYFGNIIGVGSISSSGCQKKTFTVDYNKP